MKKIIIAIDGPAASGKSTTAKLLAKKLGYVYLDTGAMYRCCALATLEASINLDDKVALTELMNKIDIKISYHPNGNIIFLNGKDVSLRIREEDISRLASDISTLQVVRERMVALQREIGAAGGVVMDGRDIGTVVFPHAELKFFMDADVKERAQRRYLELQAKGQKPNYQIILREMQERDLQDSSRTLAPLKPAKDAIYIDTTKLSIEEQVNVLMNYVMNYFNNLKK